MASEFGNIVSSFVESRIDGPDVNEDTDFWCEAVYAALFTVFFRLSPYWNGAGDSPEQMAARMNALIEAVALDSAPWIQERLRTYSKSVTGLNVSFSLAGEIKSRLTTYYNIASEAIDERDYIFRTAASHSVAAVLSHLREKQQENNFLQHLEKKPTWIERLKGRKGYSPSPRIPSSEESASAIVRVIEMCDSLWDELDEMVGGMGESSCTPPDSPSE